MDKNSKILIVIFIVLIFVSIFFTYKRAFIDRDFIILEEETEEDVVDGDNFEVEEELNTEGGNQ